MLFPIDAHLKYVATPTTVKSASAGLFPNRSATCPYRKIERPGRLICLAGPFLQRLHSAQAKCRVRPGPVPGLSSLPLDLILILRRSRSR
jgi:hypothetical protein